MTRTQVTSGRLPAPAGPFPQAGHTSQVLLFVLLALGLAISGLPSPLYGAYQREWGFSPLTLTVIFAAYALAALAALLAGVSDILLSSKGFRCSAARWGWFRRMT